MDSERTALPHETSRLFLTDGGAETWLIHKRGHELPNFSAFHLLRDPDATEGIRSYYRASHRTEARPIDGPNGGR